MSLARAFVFVLLALTGACAAKRSPDGAFTSRDLLTAEQIAETHATNAYEVVERLRPRWIRPRGTSQMPSQPGDPRFQEAQVQAYLDDQRLGPVETLRNVEIAAVRYIRYYSATDASARWGFNHGGGAIYVSTRPLDR